MSETGTSRVSVYLFFSGVRCPHNSRLCLQIRLVMPPIFSLENYGGRLQYLSRVSFTVNLPLHFLQGQFTTVRDLNNVMVLISRDLEKDRLPPPYFIKFFSIKGLPLPLPNRKVGVICRPCFVSVLLRTTCVTFYSIYLLHTVDLSLELLKTHVLTL